jgi:integrase
MAEPARQPAPGEPLKGPQEPLLVKELVLRYWRHAEAYYVKNGRPTGEHRTIGYALKPLVRLFGSSPAADFGPKRLKLLRDEMIRLGWSRRHINRQVGRVRRMFSWAASEELVSATVAGALREVAGLERGRSGAREKPEIKPVLDEVITATLAELGPMVADMVRIHRLTGMRPGELLALRVEDIDRSGEVWTYTPAAHKTEHHDRRRVIFLGPQTQAILAPHLVRAGSGRVFKIERDGYRQAVLRACERAGVEPWHPNRLRHSAGTAIRARYGLEAAKAILGHSQVETTQVYAESDLVKARDVMREVG